MPYEVDQIAVVHTALELASSRRVSEGDAIAARNEWAQQIRDAYGCLEFEITA
ncbi:MAG: hypothetical protein ACT4O5_14420 [Gammaproteobacteria bacterium]